MARIRCRYVGCVHLENTFCKALAVEFDPDEGCLTFEPVDDTEESGEWEEEVDELDAWEDDEMEDDDWLDEDDEF